MQLIERAMIPLRAYVLLLGLCLSFGCSTDTPPKAVDSPAPLRPTLSVVKDDSTELLFIYQDQEGQEQRALSPAEVPEKLRTTVQVIDLSLSPEQRQSKKFVQIFDLRTRRADGSYPGRIIARTELEQTLASKDIIPEATSVIMYSAAWCGVCKKARKFMQKEGIPFVEHDIEKNQSAAQELAQKSKRQGIKLGGVPVFDVGGQMMGGFDPNRLKQLIAKARTTP